MSNIKTVKPIKLDGIEKDYVIKNLNGVIIVKLYLAGVKEFELELYSKSLKDYYTSLDSCSIQGIRIDTLLEEFGILELVQEVINSN